MTKVVGAFDVLFLNRYDSILKDDLFGIDPTVALDADFKKEEEKLFSLSAAADPRCRCGSVFSSGKKADSWTTKK